MNYEEMTTDELDRAMAEKFGYKISGTIHGYVVWEFDDEGEPFNHIHNWNPTHKDSAQIQNYVIPKLLVKGTIEVTTQRMGNTFYMTVDKEGVRIASKLTTDPDKINETIARCILKALESVK